MPTDVTAQPTDPLSAREWAYASWEQGSTEGVTVSVVALQKLLDEVAHLRALAFAVENRITVTVEPATKGSGGER